jgi:teichuronic acid exporter
MSLRSQALSGFRWTASMRLASQLVTWAITIIVIRLLSPADYGLLAMATVFVSFLAMFSELGLGAAVVQMADLDERLLRRVFGVILAIHFSLAALLVLMAPLIAVFYDEPRVTPVIRVLAIQFVLAGFAVIPDAQLQRRMEFRNRSLLDLSGAIVASCTTLVMAFSGAGVWALVAGSILSQIWKTAGINWLSPFMHRPEFSLQGLRSLLRFGGHISAAQVFWMFYSQVDLLICAKLLGKEVLGFYSVAMHLASLPSQRISGLVNQVAFPTFSRMQNDLHSVSTNVLLGVRILSFFAFPVLWGMSSIAPEMVEVILGDNWSPSVVPLQVLALIIPLRLVANFVQVAIQGVGRSDIVMRNAIWASLIAPAVFFIGANWGGLLGLSLAWLVVSPLVVVQGLVRGLPVLGLRLGTLATSMMPAAGAGLIMYGAVAATRYFWLIEQGAVLRLCVLIAVGALAYSAVSFGLNRKNAQEVLEMLRSITTTTRQKSTEG